MAGDISLLRFLSLLLSPLLRATDGGKGVRKKEGREEGGKAGEIGGRRTRNANFILRVLLSVCVCAV